MNMSSRHALWLIVALSIIALDRTTKILVITFLPFQEPMAIWPFFNLFFTNNSGAAFSLMQSVGGWQNSFFAFIALAISGVIVFKLVHSTEDEDSKYKQLSFALILGGALGNFYDRIAYQSVIDFLDFYINDWHWPTFNIADTAICIGVAMLLLIYAGVISQTSDEDEE